MGGVEGSTKKGAILTALVLLGLLVPAPLVHLRHHLEQRQHEGHADGHEERDVDGKLLVVGEVEQVQQRRVEEGPLGRQDGLFAVLQGEGQVARLQLGRRQLQRRHRARHLRETRTKRVGFIFWCFFSRRKKNQNMLGKIL